jgi:uncharacterized protein YbgA (DUF1722 family)/uncharacterized protein YbbK (DUF523 family)
MSTRIRIAVSSCLIGQEVRYDGGHKHNEYITATLGEIFEFVPYCPEVAIGMGIPRPPIRLVKVGQAVHARGIKDPAQDVTENLLAYADKVAPKLHNVSGYILKKNSPSCGMERVKLYNAKGHPAGKTRGVYAGRLQDLHPELPFEEEGRLMNPDLRENFLERVLVYHRWQQLNDRHLTARGLVDFHTRHKFLLLAHDEDTYRALGRLVAAAGRGAVTKLRQRYIAQLMLALKKPATRARHTNVLQHIAGYFKKQLDAGDRQELQEIIASYRHGELPRVAVVTLLRHHLRRYPDTYLEQQVYLQPMPAGCAQV